MKRIVRLTESDLIKLVKRVISEQVDTTKVSLEDKDKQIRDYLMSKGFNENIEAKISRSDEVFDKVFQNNKIMVRNIYPGGYGQIEILVDKKDDQSLIQPGKVYKETIFDEDWNKNEDSFQKIKKLIGKYGI